MNIKKCDRGHFYNADKFGECPHCKDEQELSQSDMLISSGSVDVTPQVQPNIMIDKKRLADMPQTVAYRDTTDANPYAATAVQSLPPTGEQIPIGISPDTALSASIKNAYVEINDMESKGMVVGWLVAVGGPKYGRVHTLYTSDTKVEKVVISFDMHSKCFVLNFTLSENDVMINGRSVVENEYLNYMDRIFINGTDYMLVTLCKDGFSWWQTSQPVNTGQYRAYSDQYYENSYSAGTYGQKSDDSNKLQFKFLEHNYNAALVDAQMYGIEQENYSEPATSVLMSNTWRCMSCNAENSEMVTVCRLCNSPREY
ncbi:MAG: hypothetical protein E7257_08000 [Lachnospiraceae bacterium]|nr:hypothetical protein [Lachnospiraceae bacterium]